MQSYALQCNHMLVLCHTSGASAHVAYLQVFTVAYEQNRHSAESFVPAGFTNRAESEYDPFGAGHSSTSISSALGMAVARDFKVSKQSLFVTPSNK